MDWISIIDSLVTALLCSGGLYTIFTIREHKRSAKLDNDNKVIEEWKELNNEKAIRINELKETVSNQAARSEKQDDVISELRTKLDNAHTKCAIAELMRCDCIACSNRKPPFGTKEQNVEELVKGE